MRTRSWPIVVVGAVVAAALVALLGGPWSLVALLVVAGALAVRARRLALPFLAGAGTTAGAFLLLFNAVGKGLGSIG